jgi:hypothetical protein
VPGARDADEARPGRHTKDVPTPAGKKTARIRKPVWITIGAAALAVIAAVSVFAATDSPSSSPPPKVEKTTTSPAPSARPAVFFNTLPPNAKLPSGATCARLVNESPSPEVRPQNARYNHTTGQHVPASFFPEGDLSQVAELAPLITGDYTGTTEDILRWAACKWGIDQNIVFAEAAVESWWQQSYLGDWTTDASTCPPGHGLGADGKPGECPQSYGILQNKYTFEQSAWPALGSSTAMNVDAMYAIWRSCYNGDEVWLNNEQKGQQYGAGDVWGCIGRWFAGSWYTPPAEQYISRVKQYLNQQVWLSPEFARTTSNPNG